MQQMDKTGWRGAPALLGLLLSLSFVELSASADPQLVAQGQGGAPGSVTSQAIARVPEGFPLEIVVFDDTPDNLQIRDSLSDALDRGGYLQAEQAPLELTFESEVLEPGKAPRAPSLGTVRSSNETEVGNRGSARGVEAEVNVWSSTKDSLLGGRQGGPTLSSHPRYRLGLQLRDRDSGKVIWQGEAICEMLTGDRARLLRSMARPLVAALGKTVAGEPFNIR